MFAWSTLQETYYTQLQQPGSDLHITDTGYGTTKLPQQLKMESKDDLSMDIHIYPSSVKTAGEGGLPATTCIYVVPL